MSEDKDFTVEEMFELWKSGSWDDCRKRRQVFSADMTGWDTEEDGDFTQDHKYQHCTNVIKHLESGRCFEVSCSRSGSYHSDWYYTYDSDPYEVKKVEKVVKTYEWVAV